MYHPLSRSLQLWWARSTFPATTPISTRPSRDLRHPAIATNVALNALRLVSPCIYSCLCRARSSFMGDSGPASSIRRVAVIGAGPVGVSCAKYVLTLPYPLVRNGSRRDSDQVSPGTYLLRRSSRPLLYMNNVMEWAESGTFRCRSGQGTCPYHKPTHDMARKWTMTIRWSSNLLSMTI